MKPFIIVTARAAAEILKPAPERTPEADKLRIDLIDDMFESLRDALKQAETTQGRRGKVSITVVKE